MPNPYEVDLATVDPRKKQPGGATQAPGGKPSGVAGGGGVSQSASSPSSSTPRSQSGAITSFVSGAADAVTFGFIDEVGGFLSTITPIQDYKGQQSIWESGRSFGDTLAANIAVERAQAKAMENEHGASRLAGQIGGSLLIPMGSGANTAMGLAKVSAVQGGLYGVGSGVGLEDRAQKGATGAVVGGILGGTLGKLGEKAKAWFNKAPVVAKASEEVSQAATERVAKSMPEGVILGNTVDGAPILGARAVDEAGEDVPELVNALVKIEQVTGEEVGTKAGKIATQGAAKAGKAPPSQAELLEILKQKILATSEQQRQQGDRVVDITWENAPDVAEVSGEWRIGSLESTEDAQSLLSGLARFFEGKTRRPDAELGEEALSVADRIGDDAEDVLAFAQGVVGQVGQADTAMLALRTLWARMSRDVTDVHLMNVDWSTASDELVAETTQRIYNLSTLTSLVAQAKTGLGRGLRVSQLPTADVYRKMIADGSRLTQEGADAYAAHPGTNLPTTREGIQNWMELWGATGGNPRQQNAVLRGLLTAPSGWKYLRQSAANYFTASILSMPKTLALNVVGPGVVSIIRTAERQVGSAYLALRPWSTPAERATHRELAQVTARAYLQTFADIGDVFRQANIASSSRSGLGKLADYYAAMEATPTAVGRALQAAGKNQTIIGGGGSSFDTIATYGPLTDNLLVAAGQTPSWQYTLGNALNVFPKALARINNGLDEFAKRLAYQGEVRTRAMLEAEELGLSGQAYAMHVEKAMQRAYDAVGQATSATLLREAERTTMTGRLGDPGSKLRSATNLIQRMRNDIPETRYILPVFNVPANGVAETLRRLPIARVPGLNKMLFERTAKELAGDYGPVIQADAHGRTLLAAGFMLAGLQLNDWGLMTGSGPKDPDDRRIWLQTHQPYSIRVGGSWVDYRKYDILGSLLSIPATVRDASIYHAEDEQTASDIVFSGIGALTQWFKDRSALQNASALLSGGDDPTKDFSKIIPATAGNIAGGFIPAFFRGIATDASGANPYIAMRNSWDDYVMAAWPGNDVELLRNVLGEPIQKKADTVLEYMLPVTLVKAIGEDDDPVLTELDRLYQETGYGAGADTSSFSQGHFDERDLKLEDGKSFYTHAMKLRQTITVDGLTLRQALQQAVKSEEYRNGVDGDSGRKMTSRGDISRGWIVKTIFQQYNQAIKSELAATSPRALKWMTAAAAKQADDAYLRDVPTEELATNPEIWAAKGLDREVYMQGVEEAGSTASLYKALSF